MLPPLKKKKRWRIEITLSVGKNYDWLDEKTGHYSSAFVLHKPWKWANETSLLASLLHFDRTQDNDPKQHVLHDWQKTWQIVLMMSYADND